MIKKIFKAVYSVYAIFGYVFILIILLPVFMTIPLLSESRGAQLLLATCKFWARTWYRIAGIRYKSRNVQEKESPDGACVYVANHSSYADIASLVCSVKSPVRILGREDISRIPVVGYFYKKLVVTVDRTDPLSKAESMVSIYRFAKNGGSVFVFPAGGFETPGNPLSNGQIGAFRLAIETGLPIRPLLFLDNDRILPQDDFLGMQPGNCRVLVLPKVEVTGYNKRDASELRQVVTDTMTETMSKYAPQ